MLSVFCAGFSLAIAIDAAFDGRAWLAAFNVAIVAINLHFAVSQKATR